MSSRRVSSAMQKLRLLPLVLACVLPLALAAPSSGSVSASDPECSVGLTAALGTRSGRSLAAGLRAAFAESNIVGRLQLSLVALDDGGSPVAARGNAAALAASGVFAAVLTPPGAHRGLAGGVAVVAPASGEAGLRAFNASAVVLRPSYAEEAFVAVGVLANDWKVVQRMAVVAPVGPDGDEVVSAVRSALSGSLGLDLLADARLDLTSLNASGNDADAQMGAAVAGAARSLFAQRPSAVLISASAAVVARFVASSVALYENTSECPHYTAFASAYPDDLRDELLRAGVSGQSVFTGAWLPDPLGTDAVALQYVEALNALGENETPRYAGLEGYIAGRLVVEMANKAIKQHKWPLTRSSFYCAAFEAGNFVIEDFSAGPFTNDLCAGGESETSSASSTWCNEGVIHLRGVDAVRGATQPGSAVEIRQCGFPGQRSRANLTLLGQTAPTSGDEMYLGRGVRLGLVSALDLTPSGLVRPTLVTMDDLYIPSIATTNALQLLAIGEFYHNVVRLVLATDMAKHIEQIGELNGKLAAGGLDRNAQSDRLLVLRIMLKVADLSNSMRTWDIYRQWTAQVCHEFWLQGEQEQALGLPVSPFMDKNSTNIPKMQQTFLGFVVKPLAESILKIVPHANVLMENLSANMQHWAVHGDS
eukprot:m51a1_g1578 putative 3 5 -cyclic nucleotide phosphodiesterase family protein (649) ;mRNA; f:100318-104458